MKTPMLRFLAACAVTTLAFSPVAAFGAPHYQSRTAIPLPGDGGWDYVSVDPAAHRLYVTHGAQVVVVDTETDKVIGSIADTPGVHGVAIAPELSRVFTSNGRENKVGLVETPSLKLIRKVDTGTNPDAILYVPTAHEVYAFNGRSGSATVIDGKSGDVVATIPVDGKPEFAACDAAGAVFCNIEDKSVVAAIDSVKHTVRARWSLGSGEEPTGLAIDAEHHRLFSGCGNAKVIVLDSDSGKVVAEIPAGHGIDATAFDPGTQLAFASNGRDGTVTVIHEDAPDKFTVVQTLTTQRSARTMTVDPTTHRIYLVAAEYGPQRESGRPPIVPGTVRVLVYDLVE